jgi:hypothetical protein
LERAKVTTLLGLNTLDEILEVQDHSASRALIVGHDANGLLIKALPFDHDPSRVSFEGVRPSGSSIEALENAKERDPARLRIVNFYTNGSSYATTDDTALTNSCILKPDFLPIIPPTPFKTFCFVVAACENGPKRDKICEDLLTNETFVSMTRMIGRLRSSSSTGNQNASSALGEL